MKLGIRKYILWLGCAYLLGLLWLAHAYQQGDITASVTQYYLYAGGLLALVAVRFTRLFGHSEPLTSLIQRQHNILTLKSTSGFINYSKTDIPVSHIASLTIADGYLLVEPKFAQPNDKKLAFFYQASRQAIQSHLFKLLDASELNKIRLNILAD